MSLLKPFFRLFAANLTSDDLSREPRDRLFLRARNVVIVLRQRKTPEPPLRAALAELLTTWRKSDVLTLLPSSDRFWFDTPEDEDLLRELLGKVVIELRET